MQAKKKLPGTRLNNSHMYILVHSESHYHLGLFSDLEFRKDVEIIVIKKKEINSALMKRIRHVHTSWTINRRINLPFKSVWYEPTSFRLDESINYCIIFVDIAIHHIKKSFLKNLCNKSNVRCVLVCINTIDAGSIGMQQIRDKIFQIPWDDVYTFDPGDREKYGFKDVKNYYYSYHDIKPSEIDTDVFFVGGLKGGREDFIFRMFKYLRTNAINSKFYINIRKEDMFRSLPFKNEMHYYTGGWKPYEEILIQNLKANVIIEIMQEKQTGPSLRYYEAVCYNKKLITTNKRVVELPYYNSRFMKIIESPEDIDVEWVKNRETVDYGYKGDYSPIHLLDVVME